MKRQGRYLLIPLLLFAFLLPPAYGEETRSAKVQVNNLSITRTTQLGEKDAASGLGGMFLGGSDAENKLSINATVHYQGGKLKTDDLKFVMTKGVYDNGLQLKALDPAKMIFGGGTSWSSDSSTASVELRFVPPERAARKIQELTGEIHLSAVTEQKETIANLHSYVGKEIKVKGVDYPLLKVEKITKKEIVLLRLSDKSPDNVFIKFQDSNGRELEKDFMKSKTDFLDKGVQRLTVPFKEPLPGSGLSLILPVERRPSAVIAKMSLKDIELP